MVGSLAVITHSTPDTTPMPEMTPAPRPNSVPQAASGAISRKGRIAVEQQLDALARHQLAACEVPLDVLLTAGGAQQLELLVQEADLLEKAGAIGLEGLGARIGVAAQDVHGRSRIGRLQRHARRMRSRRQADPAPRQKTKGKRQKANGEVWPFVFCLLPFVFCLCLLSFLLSRSPQLCGCGWNGIPFQRRRRACQ
jgi:hypothetical protein